MSEKHKILVVEDEKDLRNIIRTILEEAGYEVVLAENGMEGLEKSRTLIPDLILCDIQMPAMNGYELLNAVKMEPELTKVPFVFMTGVNTGRFDFRKGMDLGADDYIVKPFSAENLIGAIESRLTKKQSWQKFFDSKVEQINTGIILLLPNALHILVMEILEHAQFLLMEKNLSADAIQRTAKMIQSSGKRLGHLHENILLFAMLQLWVTDQQKIGQLRQEITDSYLSVLSSIINDNARAEERKAFIWLNCTDTAIRISPAYFGKVIDEIIDNACAFSEAGTKIYVSSTEAEKEVLISIRDEGRGMSKEEASNIGSLLQNEQRTYGQIGTGMGLTIARTITEIHGGTFGIKSEPGKGTTVTVGFIKAT